MAATQSVNSSQLNVLNELYRTALQAKPGKTEDAQKTSALASPASPPIIGSSAGDTEERRRVNAAENTQQQPATSSTNLNGQLLGTLINTTA